MKCAFTLLELVIVVAVIAAIAAFLLPVFTSHHYPAPRSNCQSNLKQIGLGVLQYVQDYDERLPPARVTPTLGWVDAIYPYVKSQQVFQCPTAQNMATPFSSDYFYNNRLGRVIWDKLPSPALTLMAGEGDDNAPTWNSWNAMPPNATTNSNSPSQRHFDKVGNYLFADGHVKYLKPAAVSSTFATPTSRPTFAIR